VVTRPGEGDPWARAWPIRNAILSHVFSYESKTFSNFSLPNFPTKRQDPQKIFLRLLRGWSSLCLLNLFRDDKRKQTLPTRGNFLSYFFPLGSFGKVFELLSRIVNLSHGVLGCSWRPHSSVEIDSPIISLFGSYRLLFWKR
jgi:hypothetical protein